jgi:hypothetical protein
MVALDDRKNLRDRNRQDRILWVKRVDQWPEDVAKLA